MRLPFGFEIRRRAKKEDQNPILSRFLMDFLYGRELATPNDYWSLVRAYRNWVYVCANKNAISVASVPLRLYVAKQSTKSRVFVPTKKVDFKKRKFLETNVGLQQLDIFRKAVEVEEVLEHPFLDLMKNVNNFMNQFSLFEMTQLYQELTGNSYWLIVRGQDDTPVEVWIVPVQNMKIIPDPEQFVKGYQFKSGFKEVFLEEERVIHFKMPSPTNVYYGTGPLAAVTAAYNIGENMDKYENAIFTNMGRVEGAFETDQELSEYEFKRLKEEIKQAFGGVHNAGKSPLLEKGVHYKSYGLPPRELSYLQGRKAIKEMICNAFGQNLGMYDKDANRANAETASYVYMRDTIRPRCLRLEQKINEKLMPMYDEALFVAFDDCVPDDKEYRLKELETHLKTGYSSINEERQEDGWERVPWGDVPLLPMTLVPYGSAPPQQERPEKYMVTEEELVEFSKRVAKQVRRQLLRTT